MLDCIKLVFNRLNEFHLKIKPKSAIFDTSDLILVCVLSAGGLSANLKKVEKVWDWPTPTNTKEVHYFLWLACYYLPKFAQIAHCLHELVDPISNKTKNTKGQKKKAKTVDGPKMTGERC